MAKIKVGSDRGFDMRDIDFSNLYSGDSYVRTSKRYSVEYGDGVIDELRGSGFRYNSSGEPIAGTVQTYALFYGGKLISVEGISVAATKMGSAAETASTADDLKIIKAALSGNDVFVGGSESDYATGYNGSDKLSGKAGSDTLLGGNGNDTLIGGADRDFLRGGAGADTFLFSRVADSNISAYDKILDFSHKQHDIIDLSAIDANGSLAGNGTFNFIGGDAFSETNGELRVQIRGKNTIVEGDVDGNGVADFMIVLQGRKDLISSDFDL